MWYTQGMGEYGDTISTRDAAASSLNGQGVDSVEKFAAGLTRRDGVQAIVEETWPPYRDLSERAYVLASLNPLIANNALNLYQARLLHAYNEFRREMIIGSGHQVIKPLGDVPR